jgi:hypothetical protein
VEKKRGRGCSVENLKGSSVQRKMEKWEKWKMGTFFPTIYELMTSGENVPRHVAKGWFSTYPLAG